MDVKQVFILLLLLVPMRASRCFSEAELSEAAQRKLRSQYPQPPEPAWAAAAGSPASCPVELYRHQPPPPVSDRSLSPWRYVFVTKKDHFPSTYAEAQCLCLGCIQIRDKNPPQESHDYNSVPIKQSRVFLKREPCSDRGKYSLVPVNVEVTVGCTCVRVKTS